MKGKKKILLTILGVLCLSTACEVEGGRRSSSSLDYEISSTTSSSYINNSNNVNNSSSISTSLDPVISSIADENQLPYEAQEFVLLVNSITVDIYAGEAISNAFHYLKLLLIGTIQKF